MFTGLSVQEIGSNIWGLLHRPQLVSRAWLHEVHHQPQHHQRVHKGHILQSQLLRVNHLSWVSFTPTLCFIDMWHILLNWQLIVCYNKDITILEWMWKPYKIIRHEFFLTRKFIWRYFIKVTGSFWKIFNINNIKLPICNVNKNLNNLFLFRSNFFKWSSKIFNHSQGKTETSIILFLTGTMYRHTFIWQTYLWPVFTWSYVNSSMVRRRYVMFY